MRWRSSSSRWKNLSCEGNAAIYKADQNRSAIASTIWKFPLQPSKQVPVSEQPCLEDSQLRNDTNHILSSSEDKMHF